MRASYDWTTSGGRSAVCSVLLLPRRCSASLEGAGPAPLPPGLLRRRLEALGLRFLPDLLCEAAQIDAGKKERGDEAALEGLRQADHVRLAAADSGQKHARVEEPPEQQPALPVIDEPLKWILLVAAGRGVLVVGSFICVS